jgi:hypothetical protein
MSRQRITRNGVRVGAILPYGECSQLRVVQAGPNRILVTFVGSGNDPGARFAGKRYAFSWDGQGYASRGRYLEREVSTPAQDMAKIVNWIDGGS